MNHMDGRYIVHANMLFYPLYYDIIKPNKSKYHTGISFTICFVENQRILYVK